MNKNTLGNVILNFILKRELIIKYLFRFLLTLVGIITINRSYGYMGVINNAWLSIALSLVCAFIPVRFTGFILFLILSIHLSALSMGLCLVFIFFWLFFFLLSKAFGAKDTFGLVYMPILYRLHVPFLLSGYEGFFRKKREAIPLIGGAVIAFFLRTVRLFEASFKQSEDQIETLIIIKNNMLANMNFYVFLLAVSAMFLIIVLIKQTPIPHSWVAASVLSIVVEFIIMMSGFLFTNSQSQMTVLIISNVVSLVIFLVISLILGEYKVTRTKRLEFEDDEYNYYVVCVPKVRFEQQKKRVLRITRSKKEIEAEKSGKSEKTEKSDKKEI